MRDNRFASSIAISVNTARSGLLQVQQPHVARGSFCAGVDVIGW